MTKQRLRCGAANRPCPCLCIADELVRTIRLAIIGVSNKKNILLVTLCCLPTSLESLPDCSASVLLDIALNDYLKSHEEEEGAHLHRLQLLAEDEVAKPNGENEYCLLKQRQHNPCTVHM